MLKKSIHEEMTSLDMTATAFDHILCFMNATTAGPLDVPGATVLENCAPWPNDRRDSVFASK